VQPGAHARLGLLRVHLGRTGQDDGLQARLLQRLGEVAKEALKGSAYGQQPFRSTEEWAGELADCFFSLICLANGTGVDPGAALACLVA